MTLDNGDNSSGPLIVSAAGTGAAGDRARDAVWAHLTSPSTSVVLASVGGGVPALRYWGARLTDEDVASFDLVTARPVAQASLDAETPLGLITEVGGGFPGTPGLSGHRSDGEAFGPEFGDATAVPGRGGSAVVWQLQDPVAKLDLRLDVSLCPLSNVLQVAATITNTGATDYVVDQFAPSLALPSSAEDLLTLTGRWTLEFQTQRRRWQAGAWVSENRRGRTSHDRPPALFVGSPDFTETAGEVWGMHLGWSGNSRMVAELLADGRRHVQLGELLMSGEAVVGPGESLTTPTVYGAYSGQGLGDVSLAFHRFLRSRDHHPGIDRPRPVMLNTWEAVYFDHDGDTLAELATRAAEVGVERFVLDDGWFVGRNDDTAALGDWIVDPTKYPNGLGPLIDHVRGLGMDFGLWLEPEMINPKSELYRLHPDWALRDDRYREVLGRNQLVLDLVNTEAWKYILDHIDRLLTDYRISYVKWDMNRDLVRPTHDSKAGARAQTHAVYQLFDEIRARHPQVEFESCSSGGARADFEILARTERVWTSDSNDALDRQAIQRGFSLLFPPEVMGAHIGPPISHTTGRHHDLGIRAASAFLGHLGIEWNLLSTTAEERAELARFVALYKQHRALLHSGDWRRLDGPDPSANVMGVVAQDRSEALFVHVTTGTMVPSVPGPIRFVGLDPDRDYTVRSLDLPGPNHVRGMSTPRWLEEDGVTVSGRLLMQGGLQPPIMDPESALIVHLGPGR